MRGAAGTTRRNAGTSLATCSNQTGSTRRRRCSTRNAVNQPLTVTAGERWTIRERTRVHRLQRSIRPGPLLADDPLVEPRGLGRRRGTELVGQDLDAPLVLSDRLGRTPQITGTHRLIVAEVTELLEALLEPVDVDPQRRGRTERQGVGLDLEVRRAARQLSERILQLPQRVAQATTATDLRQLGPEFRDQAFTRLRDTAVDHQVGEQRPADP